MDLLSWSIGMRRQAAYQGSRRHACRGGGSGFRIKGDGRSRYRPSRFLLVAVGERRSIEARRTATQAVIALMSVSASHSGQGTITMPIPSGMTSSRCRRTTKITASLRITGRRYHRDAMGWSRPPMTRPLVARHASRSGRRSSGSSDLQAAMVASSSRQAASRRRQVSAQIRQRSMCSAWRSPFERMSASASGSPGDARIILNAHAGSSIVGVVILSTTLRRQWLCAHRRESRVQLVGS